MACTYPFFNWNKTKLFFSVTSRKLTSDKGKNYNLYWHDVEKACFIVCYIS